MTFKDQVLVFWDEACMKWYETELRNKTPPEVEDFRATKVRCYLLSVHGALVACFWKRSEVDGDAKEGPSIDCLRLYTILSSIIPLHGSRAAAAFFPRSTPLQPVDLTGFGAWITIVRAIACYHLDTYEFHPKPQAFWAIASFAITSAAVSVYWACTAQDPIFLHVIVKLLGWLFRWIWYKVLAIWSVAVEWMKNTRLPSSSQGHP